MAADRSAALRAFPLLFLFCQQLPDAVVLDSNEIIDHAHPEESLVFLVQVLQVSAGEITALVAKLHFTFTQPGAALPDVGALFIPWTAAGAIRYLDAFAFDIVS